MSYARATLISGYVGLNRRMLRRTSLTILVAVGLIVPTARSFADESEDGAVDIMTAAVGEVLAMSDLCGWDFAAKVEKLYQNGKSTLRLTTAQEKVIRAKVAAARGSTFGHLSPNGQARVRVDVCKDEQRARLEGILAGISFD